MFKFPEMLDIKCRSRVWLCSSLAYSSLIRHRRHHRRYDLNICVECREMLRDIIQVAVGELCQSRYCIEYNHNYDSVEPVAQQTTAEELLPMIEEFVLERRMLTEAWKMHINNKPCLQEDLHKQFMRILCILSSANESENDCAIHKSLDRPWDFQTTLDSTANFIRNVTGTLNGFLYL